MFSQFSTPNTLLQPRRVVNPESLLPLKTTVFQILLTLLDGERHGYVLMQEIAERTSGELRILPGAMYRFLQRMLEDGLIRESDQRRSNGTTHEQRRSYAITKLGRRVAEAEARRLNQLVEYSKSKNLLKKVSLEQRST